MLVAQHRLPYSESGCSGVARCRTRGANRLRTAMRLQFGHSLQAQIGDLLAAGFHLTALYEDHWQRRVDAARWR